jgi:hypothetical protein
MNNVKRNECHERTRPRQILFPNPPLQTSLLFFFSSPSLLVFSSETGPVPFDLALMEREKGRGKGGERKGFSVDHPTPTGKSRDGQKEVLTGQSNGGFTTQHRGSFVAARREAGMSTVSIETKTSGWEGEPERELLFNRDRVSERGRKRERETKERKKVEKDS